MYEVCNNSSLLKAGDNCGHRRHGWLSTQQQTNSEFSLQQVDSSKGMTVGIPAAPAHLLEVVLLVGYIALVGQHFINQLSCLLGCVSLWVSCAPQLEQLGRSCESEAKHATVQDKRANEDQPV